MFTRLCKAWRFWRQTGEFALTKQENVVMSALVRILTCYPGYEHINTCLWEQIIHDEYPTVRENDLSMIMLNLGKKLLKQTDYD